MSNKKISWTKLFLEAIAIFLGVSAGFFAENYRQYVDERRQEQEALTQILRDLAIDAADLRPIVEASEGIAQSMVWLHNNFRDTDVGIELVAQQLSSIPPTHSYEAASAAYTGLKASGSLDLIQDAQLLSDLFFYFEDRQAAMEALNEWVLDGEISFWSQVGPYVVYGPAPDLVDRPAVEDVDLNRMRSDRSVDAEIVWNGSVNEGQARDGRVVLNLNTDLVQTVEQYLATLK